MNYVLLGADGRPYRSDMGGHRRTRIYSHLDWVAGAPAAAPGAAAFPGHAFPGHAFPGHCRDR